MLLYYFSQRDCNVQIIMTYMTYNNDTVEGMPGIEKELAYKKGQQHTFFIQF